MEWKDYRAGRLEGKPPKPADIPSHPETVFRDDGWAGVPDWLGTDYRPFTEARAWVHGLGVRGKREWQDYCAGRIEGKPPMPADIPANPASVYKNEGWMGWGDWFGTGTIAPFRRTFRPFSEARAWARGLGLQGVAEWKDYCAGRIEGKPPKPADIPSNPYTIYRHEGWISWGDWVGTGSVHGSKRTYRSFSEARAWVRGLGLRSVNEWNDYCVGRLEGKPPKPVDIPNHPYAVYKTEGWAGVPDWLGTDYRPFTEARAWVRGLGLSCQRDWDDFCEGRLEGKPPKPADIPRTPSGVYRNKGWLGLGDWLGTGTLAPSMRTYRPFTEAREWVRGLGLRSEKEWKDYCAGRLEGKPPKPADVPKSLDHVYKDMGWIGWSDFLGTDRKPRKPKKKPS